MSQHWLVWADVVPATQDRVPQAGGREELGDPLQQRQEDDLKTIHRVYSLLNRAFDHG